MDKYISLELAKKLHEAGCELESEWYWNEQDKQRYENVTWRIIWDDWLPAYDILNDICVKYREDFWWAWVEAIHTGSWYCDEAWRLADVLQLLNEWKKQEAEDCIWKHCLFNPNNE